MLSDSVRVFPFLNRRENAPVLFAKRVDEQFFLLLGQAVKRFERGNIAAKRGDGQSGEGCGRQPGVAEPAACEKNDGRDSPDKDLNAKSRPNSDTIISLTLKFADFHFFGKLSEDQFAIVN